MNVIIWLFIVFCNVSIYSSQASEYSLETDRTLLELYSDSGIKGPPYQKIVDSLVRLQAQYPDSSELIRYGQTLKGRPLVGLRIAFKRINPPLNAKTILIAGSIHGNEYLNIEDRLPFWILSESTKSGPIKTYLNRGGSFLMAPILNPDGYDARERENDHGKDLNRDFNIVRENYKGFNEPETKALGEWVDREVKNRKLAITMDYHCCIGAVLRPWSFTRGGELPTQDEAKFMAIKDLFYRVFDTSYKYGRTPIILGYSALGTSKDYYYEKYGALSFTFEGKYKKENTNFEKHKKMWLTFVEYANRY